MQTWIVEGTRCASFKLAMIAAQLLADSQQVMVPIVLERGAEELIVVRMIEPKTDCGSVSGTKSFQSRR